MAPRLNELPLGWVEEPIPADRPEAEWRRLAEAYTARLAGGENLRGQDLLRAASDPWLGVVQPDVGKWGGVSGCSAVGQAAVEAGKLYCPHLPRRGLGPAAPAHLLAPGGGAGLVGGGSHPTPPPPSRGDAPPP